MVLLPDEDGRVLPVRHLLEGPDVGGGEVEAKLASEHTLDFREEVLIVELSLHSAANNYYCSKEI